MDDAASANPVLVRYVELAKTTRGAATAALIKKVLSQPKLFVFGELIHLPAITALRGTAHEAALELLEIFAYGTYDDIKADPSKFTLNEAQTVKIKQLTVVSMASAKKTLSYAELQARLDITEVRALEDLVISCFYAGIVEGKLNQRSQQLHVSNAMGRDVRAEDIDAMVAKLTAWRARSVGIMGALERRMADVKGSHKAQEETKTNHDMQANAMRVEAIKQLTARAAGPAPGTAAAGAAAAGSWGAGTALGYNPDEATRRGRPKRRIGQVGGGRF